MAELSTIARPYAEALFDVAQSGDINYWSELVQGLADVIRLPDVAALIDTPKVSPAQVVDFLSNAVKAPNNTTLCNFLSVLAERGRLLLMSEISKQFDVLKNTSAGSADVQIESAFPIDDTQLSDLVVVLERKFDCKLNANVRVNPLLLGGVRVVVGDQVLDTSVRARLVAMQASLMG
ncbi:F0F1 ATP synthase subunit delta [Candidatus Pandoraea novymonadis]|uniref:ATP synthase subunit delta n=1 Tax=Candidatus Pandoraea novymonadis TaxID=1808959 RepID=A0ABX5FFH2_9BURK|nr:F0F1 ATP synthase subunit delta [Candidatus Pandoraea novymonadis]PSB92464.1 ATP synthase subunit delta [Candidatus Pandoraea novymonadis]